MASTTSEVQLNVQFVTKLPESFRVSDVPLTVPGSTKRSGLSKIINHLLNLDPPQPFDFVVEGELLRSTLQEHFLEKGLSVETIAVIEYIPILLPSKTDASEIHDDWVNSIDGKTETLLSASYDGVIKGWKHSLEPLWSIAAHEHSVSCIRHVSNVPEMFLTASQDHTVKAWTTNDSSIPNLEANLTGHDAAVCAVDSNPDGNRCCSVGWNGHVLIWPCGPSLIEAESTSKPSKRQKGNKTAVPSVKEIESIGTLQGHQGCVSDVVWYRKHSLFTAGWDHTLRQWDVRTGIATETFTSQRVIHSIATPRNGISVVAFGSSDGILRLWDARTSTDHISIKLYRSHTNWIASVSWSSISDFHLASASYDTTVRLWDIRGPIPLLSSQSHKDKCLTVDWRGEWNLVSGGADCMIHCHDVHPSLS